MSEKYIDLADRIMAATATTPNTMRSSAIGDTLEYLDAHPGQVPGRTITESEISKAFGPEYVAWARMCLARIGITVVPDPEPTNAEKLVDDLLGCHVAFSEREVDAIAGHLAERGWTKAPGGDDE